MKILRKFKKLAGQIIKILYRLVYRLIRVDDKLVIFISFHGRGYSDCLLYTSMEGEDDEKNERRRTND